MVVKPHITSSIYTHAMTRTAPQHIRLRCWNTRLRHLDITLSGNFNRAPSGCPHAHFTPRFPTPIISRSQCCVRLETIDLLSPCTTGKNLDLLSAPTR